MPRSKPAAKAARKPAAKKVPVKRQGFVVPASLAAVASDATRTPKVASDATKPLASDATGAPGVASDATPKAIAHDFVPSNEAELKACLADPMWRLCSGQLYKIMVKSAVSTEGGEDETFVVPFKPNRTQRRIVARLWHRNVILKARQMGCTTLVAIMWLDHALFNADQRCGIVAHNEKAAVAIFRDKVRFAYTNLPPSLREAMPLRRGGDRADELIFGHNNSSIQVATSLRSGTTHRLHVSEYGKICAKFPEKALEVMTGTLPSVPLDGIAIIESTAEGQEGDFFDKTKRAMAQAQQGTKLTQRDYRLHFFAWWQDDGYRMDPAGVPILDTDRLYFAKVEGETGTKLDDWQRAWYVATRDADFSGDPEKMWQEYPSTAKEAFQVSTEGVYYAVQLTQARKEGRIGRVPYTPGVPVNTFWDIGNSDGTAIWLHQRVGFENRFVGFIEAWGEPYSYFVRELQTLQYVWDTHYLPHDAGHKRQQGDKVESPEDMLRAQPLGGNWLVLPPVDEVIHGIQKTREAFGTYWFDAERCAKGIQHLDNYRKTWDRARGAWKINTPSKIDGHSEAADALRQHGQGYVAPSLIRAPSTGANWRVA